MTKLGELRQRLADARNSGDYATAERMIVALGEAAGNGSTLWKLLDLLEAARGEDNAEHTGPLSGSHSHCSKVCDAVASCDTDPLLTRSSMTTMAERG